MFTSLQVLGSLNPLKVFAEFCVRDHVRFFEGEKPFALIRFSEGTLTPVLNGNVFTGRPSNSPMREPPTDLCLISKALDFRGKKGSEHRPAASVDS